MPLITSVAAEQTYMDDPSKWIASTRRRGVSSTLKREQKEQIRRSTRSNARPGSEGKDLDLLSRPPAIPEAGGVVVSSVVAALAPATGFPPSETISDMADTMVDASENVPSPPHLPMQPIATHDTQVVAERTDPPSSTLPPASLPCLSAGARPSGTRPKLPKITKHNPSKNSRNIAKVTAKSHQTARWI